MKPSQIGPHELLRQAEYRRQRIARMETELDQERSMRTMDACWLVRNTDLTRTVISALLGISRVTLDKYLDHAGMTAEYLAEVRHFQKEKGIVLFSPDVSSYLESAHDSETETENSGDTLED